MNFQEWIKLFAEQLSQTKFIELMVVGFGILQVFLAQKNNILLYLAGIISIILSMFLLLEAKLYADTLLNIYYLAMSIYGWMTWHKRKREGVRQVSFTTKSEMLTAMFISTFGFAVLYFALNNYTNSDVPFMDAFVSATAWAGMWLLAKRKIENWIFLNISNLAAIPLLAYKHLAMMAVLTFILFIMAIFGYLNWKKIYKSANQVNLNENHCATFRNG